MNIRRQSKVMDGIDWVLRHELAVALAVIGIALAVRVATKVLA